MSSFDEVMKLSVSLRVKSRKINDRILHVLMDGSFQAIMDEDEEEEMERRIHEEIGGVWMNTLKRWLEEIDAMDARLDQLFGV